MNLKYMLIILISFLIIGSGAILFGTDLFKKETVEKPKENVVEEGIRFDKDGKLLDSKYDGKIFTEKGKITLNESKKEIIITKNIELKKIKDEYKIDYNIYETVEDTKSGEVKIFLAVFENNSKKDYINKMNFPCEYFTTIYETEDFLDTKKDCKAEQEIELKIPAGKSFNFILGKLFIGEEKEKTIYLETPFEIKEAKITVQ